jgi:hypothetical protein
MTPGFLGDFAAMVEVISSCSRPTLLCGEIAENRPAMGTPRFSLGASDGEVADGGSSAGVVSGSPPPRPS